MFPYLRHNMLTSIRVALFAATCLFGIGTPGLQSSAAAQEAAQTSGTSLHKQPEASKDPETAQWLSLLGFGAAHYYTGETGKAVALTAIPMATLMLGVAHAATSSDCGVQDAGEYQCDSGATTGFLVAASGYVISWVYGVIDAAPSARRVNARMEAARQGQALRYTVMPIGSGGWQIGIALPSQ